MKNNRTKNSMRNINAGLINRIINIIFPFINRTVILWYLGSEFTGLTSLFASILSVLNVAELGFNTAVVYNLYKPVSENDEEKICEIVSILKKIYIRIGTIMLIIGMAIMPFLPYLIKGAIPSDTNIYFLYFLYLINSVISYYLFAYKECILIANQRNDIVDNCKTIINVAMYVLQFLVLILKCDFYVYLLIAILGTVVNSLIVNFLVQKKYPFFHLVKIDGKIPHQLKKNVSGLTIAKICDTFRNSFDSLIISSMLGLTATAIYNNYYYIFVSLYAILLVICNSMAASVGNSIIERTKEENYSDMLVFSQIFAWILGWTTVSLMCLYQPFMNLWVGPDLLLSNVDMTLFCLYFYLINLNNIRNQYINGNGYWQKLKLSYVIEAVLNLILNFVLGIYLGITGVLLSTILTIFFLNYLYRNAILFKNYFKDENIFAFYKEQGYYMLVTLIIAFISFIICSRIELTGILQILAISCFLIVVPNILFYLSFCITHRFKQTKHFIKNVVLKNSILFCKEKKS